MKTSCAVPASLIEPIRRGHGLPLTPTGACAPTSCSYRSPVTQVGRAPAKLKTVLSNCTFDRGSLCPTYGTAIRSARSRERNRRMAGCLGRLSQLDRPLRLMTGQSPPWDGLRASPLTALLVVRRTAHAQKGPSRPRRLGPGASAWLTPDARPAKIAQVAFELRGMHVVSGAGPDHYPTLSDAALVLRGPFFGR